MREADNQEEGVTYISDNVKPEMIKHLPPEQHKNREGHGVPKLREMLGPKKPKKRVMKRGAGFTKEHPIGTKVERRARNKRARASRSTNRR